MRNQITASIQNEVDVRVNEASTLARRDFLKVGIGFSAAVACAGLLPGLTGCSASDKKAAASFQYLQQEDVALFSALAPAVVADIAALTGPLRAERIDAVLHNIDGACAALSLHQQQELRKLLDLLAIGPLRWALTGVGAWQEASVETLQKFLSRWRASGFSTLNAGVNALIKLISVSYFVLPVSWPSAGYPGPLEYVYKAVNS